MIEFLPYHELASLAVRSAIAASDYFRYLGPGASAKPTLAGAERDRPRDTPRGCLRSSFRPAHLRDPQIIGRTIARQFPTAVRAPTLSRLLRQMAEEGGIDPVRLAAQTLDVNRKFVGASTRLG
jgi:hypothetical protein